METSHQRISYFAFSDIQVGAIRSLLQESFLNRRLILSPGLIDGKLGLCINMLFCGNKFGDPSLIENGNLLLNEICQEVSLRTPPNFKEGLIGIGWGIQHLLDNDFLKINPKEILSEIDHIVKLLYNMRPGMYFDFNSGHLGRCLYLVKALSGRSDLDDLPSLLLRQTAISAIEQVHITIGSCYKELSREKDEPDCYWNLPIVIQLLALSKEMDVFIIKVEKASELLIRSLTVPQHQLNKLAIASKLISLTKILPSNENVFDICQECISVLKLEDLMNELGGTQDDPLLKFDLMIASFLYSHDLMDSCIEITHVLNSVECALSNSLKDITQLQQSYNTSMIIAQRLRLFDGYLGFYKLLH